MTSKNGQEKAPRSLSLDVFRGLTMAGMILVNNSGGDDRYRVLTHAHWNGFTPTDLVFPTFVFIVGISIVLSMSRRHSSGQSDWQLIRHIIVRAAVLFLLGMLWSINPLDNFCKEMSTIRVMGVLQRIALAYMFTSIFVMYAGRRGQIIALFTCLISYWLLVKCVPVPGHGAGVLTKEGNLVAYIDNLLLKGHLYGSGNWEPEGLLSTIPAIGTCLLGALTGQYIKEQKNLLEKISGLFAASCMLMMMGFIAGRYFPINKNLWSPSYVMLTGGLSMMIYAFTLYIVDHKGVNKPFMPFVWLGMNPLFAYLMSSLMRGILSLISLQSYTGQKLGLDDYFYTDIVARILSPKTAAFTFALTYVIIWTGITGLMYRKKWFVKL